jgi:hypothetical protein
MRLKGQQPAQLLADARDQIRATRLDSAITLLHAVTTSPKADSSERAEAFLWFGVAAFYKSPDSVGNSFRNALANNPLMMPAGILARLDSALAAVWEREQTTVLCGEALPGWLWTFGDAATALNSDARAAQGPRIVSGPTISYPDNLLRAGVQGLVVVRALIDSLGRVERGSVRIVTTAHHDFNDPATQYTQHTKFSAAVSGTKRVRSCVVRLIDFRIKQH